MDDRDDLIMVQKCEEETSDMIGEAWNGLSDIIRTANEYSDYIQVFDKHIYLDDILVLNKIGYIDSKVYMAIENLKRDINTLEKTYKQWHNKNDNFIEECKDYLRYLDMV